MFCCCCFSGQIMSHIVWCMLWDFKLNLFDPIEFMSSHTTLYTFWTCHMNFCSRIICSKEPICLSLLMHPTEKKWEKRCFEVFSQGLEEMHQELSKDGEDHKLGDVKTTPLDQHTLGLHTSNFWFSIETLYRINLERLFVCFVLVWFLFCETTTLSFIWERDTGNMGWNMLDAFIILGKWMFELIQKDTYSCMIHVLFNEY